MYFILSKVLYILILPFMWAFGLLVYAALTRSSKRRRKLVITVLALLYLFGNPILFSIYAKAWDIERYKPSNKKYSSIIVLGGFTSQDENGKGFFNDSKDRFVQAKNLLDNHTGAHLLVSGGNGTLNPDGFTEGEYVRGVLKGMNYPDSLILIEKRSRNTFENAAYSHAILKKANLKPPYLLVTSAFHMRRSLLIFKKEGLDVVPYPCDYKVSKGPLSLFDILPASETYGHWNLYIKELIGYAVSMLK